MNALAKVWQSVLDLFSEDERDEPGYDPVYLGGAVVVTIATLGCLYWLLWTLLVYEGGIFLKFWAVGRLLFTKATLADLGYEGSYAQGDFEGWFGNCAALVLFVVLIAGLRRLYREAAAKRAKAG